MLGVFSARARTLLLSLVAIFCFSSAAWADKELKGDLECGDGFARLMRALKGKEATGVASVSSQSAKPMSHSMTAPAETLETLEAELQSLLGIPRVEASGVPDVSAIFQKSATRAEKVADSVKPMTRDDISNLLSRVQSNKDGFAAARKQKTLEAMIEESLKAKASLSSDDNNWMVNEAAKRLKQQGMEVHVRDYMDRKILVIKSGNTRLGHIAKAASEKMDRLELIYDPTSLTNDFQAAYDSMGHSILLSHKMILGPDELNEVLIHELRHAKIATEYRQGRIPSLLGNIRQERTSAEVLGAFDRRLPLDEAPAFHSEAIALRAKYRAAIRRGDLIAAQAELVKLKETLSVMSYVSKRNRQSLDFFLATLRSDKVDRIQISYDGSASLDFVSQTGRNGTLDLSFTQPATAARPRAEVLKELEDYVVRSLSQNAEIEARARSFTDELAEWAK
jgi:hypothetical protein